MKVLLAWEFWGEWGEVKKKSLLSIFFSYVFLVPDP